MKKRPLLLASLCCLMLASCATQNLQSDSGLYSVKLRHSYKAVVDGAWSWGKGNPFEHQKSGKMYIAPLNVKAVEKEYPRLTKYMVDYTSAIMKSELTKAFNEVNKANDTSWGLTNNPAEADLRVDIAVVKLRTQQPGLWAAGTVATAAAPVPGLGIVVDEATKGDIVIEGTLTNNRTNELLVAFKDSNRAKLRFYHKDKYSRIGNVDANLMLWAKGLAKFCRAGAYDKLQGGRLTDKVKNRSWWAAFVDHLSL